jgi:hypothetical protein
VPLTQPSDTIETGILPDGCTGLAQRLAGNANARKHGASTLKRAVKERVTARSTAEPRSARRSLAGAPSCSPT